LNVDDFQDPKKLDAFIARFSAMYDANNFDPSQSAALTILSSKPNDRATPAPLGLDQNTLISFRNLKR
jgi:DNA gyrase inhibitor GyrI